MKKSEIRYKLSKLVDRIPPGRSDKKLLGEILDEISYRFCGEDLLDKSDKEILEINTLKLIEIIKRTIGLNKEEDIFKSTEKLKKYDYHDFFAPVLYEKMLHIEERLVNIREEVEDFNHFLEEDSSIYITAVLENTFNDKHDEIANIYGEVIVNRDQYFKLRKDFFDSVNAKILGQYSKLVKSFKDKVMESKKDVALTEIMRFNRVKSALKNKIYNLEII